MPTNDTVEPEVTDHIVCCNCGNEIGEDDERREYDSDIYCIDCFIESFVTCDSCNDTIPNDDAHYHDDNTYCEDCFNDRFFTCDHCGEIAHNDDRIVTNNYDSICENCYFEYYFTCECCECVLHNDYYGGDGYCVDCEDSRRGIIHEYSYKPTWAYHGGDRYNPSDLFMGFEIEFEYKGNTISDMLEEYFYDDSEDYIFKHDRSLDNGAELVSHPRTLLSHKEYEWKSALSFLSNHSCKSHDTTTCGIHVHVNRNFFSMAELVKLGIFVNMQSDQFVKLARRSSEKWSKYKKLEKGSLKHSSDSESRYEAVNFTPYRTVEFRMFRGSLKYDTVLATLELVDAVCRFIKTASFPQLVSADSWNQFSIFVNDNKKEYAELIKYADKRSLQTGGTIFNI